MKKSSKKSLIRVGAAALAFVLAIGALSFIGKKTGGFTDDVTIENLTKKELNEDNLYTAEILAIKKYNTGAGVVVDTKDDGAIVIDGKLGGEDALDIKVGSIDLKAGTYAFGTHANAGTYSAYMYATADNGTTKLAFDFGGIDTDGVFEIATADSYDLYIHIEPDVEFNHVQFLPTIVEGDEVGEFYAK